MEKKNKEKALANLKNISSNGEFSINEITQTLKSCVFNLPEEKVKQCLYDLLIQSVDLKEPVHNALLGMLKPYQLDLKEIEVIADYFSKSRKLTKQFSTNLISLYTSNS